MADYPVRDGNNDTVVAEAYDAAWSRPDAHRYEDDYPVLDGNGATVAEVRAELGAERITDPLLDADAWTEGAGWSVAEGEAACDGTQSGPSDLYSGASGLNGKTMRIAFEITERSAGFVRYRIGGRLGSFKSATGEYSFDVAVTDAGSFGIQAHPDFVGTVKNISLREVL